MAANASKRIRRLIVINLALVIFLGAAVFFGLIASPDRGSAGYTFRMWIVRAINGAFTVDDLYKLGMKEIAASQTERAKKWLHLAAQEGHAKATLELAKIFMKGESESDIKQALEYYLKAGGLGVAEAYLHVGKLYLNGFPGSNPDASEAAKFLQLAAKGNVAEAQGLMSELYAYGYGVSQDWGEAYTLAKRGADNGDGLAQANCGFMMFYGLGVAKDTNAALVVLREAEKKNIASALVTLSEIYATEGPQRDINKAKEYVTKAAGLNDAVAVYRLALLYEDGTLVEKNQKKAVELYLKSAKQGYARSERAVGWAYLKGNAVAYNSQEGLKWLTKSAEHGEANAQYDLGNLYWTGGFGVQVDQAVAIKWYRAAAEAGLTRSFVPLGLAYFYGRGVALSKGEGLRWIKAAAEKGDVYAQKNLASIYFSGDGVSVDLQQAMKWAELTLDDRNSKFIAGWVYLVGATGVFKDEQRGFNFIHNAALDGQPYAAEAMGDFYRNSNLVRSDLVISHAWYLTAAALGANTAQQKAEKGGLSLAASQANRAKKIAEELLDEVARRNKNKDS